MNQGSEHVLLDLRGPHLELLRLHGVHGNQVEGVLLHRCQETTELVKQHSKGILHNTTETKQHVAVYDFL